MEGRMEISLAFIGDAVLFLPKLLEGFGKNEQVKSLLNLLHRDGRIGPGPVSWTR